MVGPVVPTFPRTVPRTISFPREHRQSITDSAFVPVRQNVLTLPAGDPTPPSGITTAGCQVAVTGGGGDGGGGVTQTRILDEAQARINAAAAERSVEALYK